MTSTALITFNAVLGAVVCYALLHLLVSAIWAGRPVQESEVRKLPTQVERRRMAA